MYLEIPKKLQPLVDQAHLVAQEVFRPISRKYDLAEHAYPKELDMLAAVMDGMNEGDAMGGAGAGKLKREKRGEAGGVRNGSNMSTVLGLTELCWGDVGLALTIPRQGLGNAAIAAVANEEQLARFGKKWASMAITEPGAGSDSAAIRTTAKKDGDHYVLNGEKIFVTAGDRCDCVVVWATLDPNLGRAAIKSFVVEKGTPGMEVARLEHKLGIKASDTATLLFTECRVPKENLLVPNRLVRDATFDGLRSSHDVTKNHSSVTIVRNSSIVHGRKRRSLIRDRPMRLNIRWSLPTSSRRPHLNRQWIRRPVDHSRVAVVDRSTRGNHVRFQVRHHPLNRSRSCRCYRPYAAIDDSRI